VYYRIYHEWGAESPFMNEPDAARVGVGLSNGRDWPLRNDTLPWLWGVGVWTSVRLPCVRFSVSISDEEWRSCE